MKRTANHNAAKTFFAAVVLVCLALTSLPPRAAGQEIPYSVLTITNPTPVIDQLFTAFAAVGEDRALIGVCGDASGTGAAYLYSIQGELLATFTRPTGPGSAYFGYGVTSVGPDRLLIGAPRDSLAPPRDGAAYLFLTNGTLLATFTNPPPSAVYTADFGRAVTPFGVDRVLIGAPEAGLTQTGAAFLFDTNGMLLTTFTKPASARPEGDYFGYAVAALGTDRVLVGAPETTVAGPTNVGDPNYRAQGAAFLYTTNGTHLTTFTNPVPHAYDNFGFSMVAVGTDRFLVGAGRVAINEGADRHSAYLFNTNGAVLMTFTNPTAATTDGFGYSVAVVGGDKLLISDRLLTNTYTGLATTYLFSTNGVLLATFPKPGAADFFGSPMAAVGRDRFLISSKYSKVGGIVTSGVYLFTLGYPPLSISGADTSFTVGWNSVEPGLVLQQADTMSTPTLWADVPGAPTTLGTTNTCSLTVPPEVSSRFYKLRRP